ncbi:NAD(P)-dependent oxidoreductase [Nocardiopsis halotolerans]|uniref:NAD(P)-dependent oxidoreductase n=1 Tax=Nocardiopsis halotolerans TaxID=124252 RepID=UPI000345793D|nr:NAD(P)H-binding protein [Nocardiopsis halotolerans]
MTRVVVLGATGRAGSAVLTQLPPEVQATAALRKPDDLSRLPVSDGSVTGVVVDIDDTESLRRATAEADVVVNAVRLRGDIDPMALVDLHERVTEATRSSANASVLVVTIGGAGALMMPDGTRFWQHPSFPEVTLPRGRAHARLRAHLEAREDGPPWAYLIPPPAFVPEGPRTGNHSMWPPAADESDFRGRSISYTDFADAVCTVVEGRLTGVRLVAASY